MIKNSNSNFSKDLEQGILNQNSYQGLVKELNDYFKANPKITFENDTYTGVNKYLSGLEDQALKEENPGYSELAVSGFNIPYIDHFSQLIYTKKSAFAGIDYSPKRIISVNPNKIKQAQKLKDIITSYAQQTPFKNAIEGAVLNGILYPMGIVEVNWDSSKMTHISNKTKNSNDYAEGDLTFTSVNMLNLF